MSEQDPTLVEVLNAAIAKRLLELHTMCPGLIISYNADERTAAVQPCPTRMFRSELASTPMPVLPRCIVAFPYGGGATMTWPLFPGDPCLLLFAERSLEGWTTNGGVYDPPSNRRHHLSDAIVLPCCPPRNTTAEASATTMWIGKADGTNGITIDLATGNITIAGTLVSLASGQDLGTFLTTLHSAIAGWTPVPNDGGAALKAALAGWLAMTPPS